MTRPSVAAPSAWRVVWWFGFVSLAADMVYEGARSVYGPVLAALGASALVVATPWPEYRQVAAGDVATRMVRGLVLDANGYLNATLGTHDGIEHVTVGRTCK